MRRIFLTISLLALVTSAVADNLYKVPLYSHADAATLRGTGVEPLAWVDGSYLILADAVSGGKLRQAGLEIELVASGISRDRLALDGRIDDVNATRFRVLYEDPGVRVLEVQAGRLTAEDAPEGLIPILNKRLKIEYYDFRTLEEISFETSSCITTLVDFVSQDSLYNYVCSLQAYPYRAAGTDNNLGAREWIYRKFQEFGYTDIELWDFFRYFTYGTNVIACKPGTLYPDRQVLVTGHYDAVINSPGADDNASGVACVLEIARILKDVDLPVTLLFIAFDVEEKGLYGSIEYAKAAVERGDNISLVQNMDMIGAEGNDTTADLYYGPEIAYARLWKGMAQLYSGINGTLIGSFKRSDHYAFEAEGFDVCFSMEDNWSDYFHTPQDSTTHMNFDYLTRMAKASLATVYTAGNAPGQVVPVAITQPGGGESVKLHWHPANWSDISRYMVGYFPTDDPEDLHHVSVAYPDTCTRIVELTEGREYGFFVQGLDEYGYQSIPYFRCLYGTPQSIPVAPEKLLALPILDGLQLTWNKNNSELDLHHYNIFRDGEFMVKSCDTFYTDSDPSLGSDFHSYYVTAVDSEGKSSEPSNTVESRAAALVANSILAINRSGNHSMDFVSAYETEVFMHEALQGLDFTYYCDTTATKYPFDMPQLDLIDMIDYGILVIGAESGGWDEIGLTPDRNGILDTIAYYMSIGGKVVMFGRWGDVWSSGAPLYDTIDYIPTIADYDDAYKNSFHINYRVATPTIWNAPSPIQCDLIGAHKAVDEYPELVWDSAMTMIHSNAQTDPVIGTGGIPCAGFVNLGSNDDEVIYTYDSRDDDPHSEGKPVAWRHIGENSSYVWFEIPLSFFDRQPAIDALRQAVMDVMNDTQTDITDDTDSQLPTSFALRQNYPNPFNPNTTIEYQLARAANVKLAVYNLLGQEVRILVDEYQTVGTKTVEWDGRNDSGNPIASGIYFYRISTDEFTESKKMIMLK